MTTTTGSTHSRTRNSSSDIVVPPTAQTINTEGHVVASPSFRRSSNNRADGVDEESLAVVPWDTNGTNNATIARQEQNLFSPRSTAAMALSSISQQIYTSVQQQQQPMDSNATVDTTNAASYNRHHDSTTATTITGSNSNSSSSSKVSNDLSTTMTIHQQDHSQLPPPQSLFTTVPSPTDAVLTTTGEAPLIPCVPTIHRERLEGGPSPRLMYTDSSQPIPVLAPPNSHPMMQVHLHQHHEQHQKVLQQHSFPTPSPPDHPITMMHHDSFHRFPQEGRPGYPPIMNEEPIPYTLPRSQQQHQPMMVHGMPPSVAGTNSNESQQQHNQRYDSQYQPSNYHQSYSGHAYSGLPPPPPPPHHHHRHPSHDTSCTTNGMPPVSWTPAPGPKREMYHHPSDGGRSSGNWTTPFQPQQTMKRPSTDEMNGTPNNVKAVYHSSNPANHRNNNNNNNNSSQMTPHHPINRCGSYGSTGSHSSYQSCRGVVQQPQPQPQPSVQHHPAQPPMQQVVVSSSTVPYHRTVSWSNNESQHQWLPAVGGPPPQYTPMIPRHSQYYPPPSHMYPGGVVNVNQMYHYVTPTPHKKQKCSVESNVTPSTHTVFQPPRPAITKKSESLELTLMSSSNQICDDSQLQPQDDDVDQGKTPAKEKSNISNENEDRYNRKNKSLGVLAESFVSHFTDKCKDDNQGNEICQEVMIDHLSNELLVERRRIYDVVNILESLKVIIKRGKNTYHWMGREHLTRQFALLQNEAIESWPKHAAKSNLLSVGSTSINGAEQSSEIESNEINGPTTSASSALCFIGQTKNEIHTPAPVDSVEGPNKSLTRLSILFLQVYLINSEPLSLPQASELIHGGRCSNEELIALGMKPGDEYPSDKKKLQQVVARGLKTKIRRLYDIANVFLSVGLLQKTENRTAATSEGKRPSYSLNYHLSIQDIRSVYFTLPPHMIQSKCPFSKLQVSKLEKKLTSQLQTKYFGLSEPIPSQTKQLSKEITEPTTFIDDKSDDSNNKVVVSPSCSDEKGMQNSNNDDVEDETVATTPPSTSPSSVMTASPRRVSLEQ